MCYVGLSARFIQFGDFISVMMVLKRLRDNKITLLTISKFTMNVQTQQITPVTCHKANLTAMDAILQAAMVTYKHITAKSCHFLVGFTQ